MSWKVIKEAKLEDKATVTLSRQWLGYDIDWERNGNRRCLAFEIKDETLALKQFEDLIKRGIK